MSDDDRERGGVIPLDRGHWWPAAAQEAVAARAATRGSKQMGWRELAAELVALGVRGANDDKVRRCVTGTVVTWEIAIPLSKLLGIGQPAYIAATSEIAAAMANAEILDEVQRLLRKARSMADRISAETGQTGDVSSTHGRDGRGAVDTPAFPGRQPRRGR